MKKIIFFEIFRKLKQEPRLMKKVKSIVAVGLVGFVIVAGLTIWAGISAVKYVVTSANQVVSLPTTQAYLQNAKNNLQQLQFQPLSCWGKAQSLLAVQPWIEMPVLDNLRDLKLACLDSKTVICEGHDCEQMKKLINTAEGRTK